MMVASVSADIVMLRSGEEDPIGCWVPSVVSDDGDLTDHEEAGAGASRQRAGSSGRTYQSREIKGPGAESGCGEVVKRRAHSSLHFSGARGGHRERSVCGTKLSLWKLGLMGQPTSGPDGPAHGKPFIDHRPREGRASVHGLLRLPKTGSSVSLSEADMAH
jgi:hypothetical protein